MKAHDAERHPGPFRIPRVDAEAAGIIVAFAFVVLGVVGLPIGKWFLLGAVLFGGLIALLLRVLHRN